MSGRSTIFFSVLSLSFAVSCGGNHIGSSSSSSSPGIVGSTFVTSRFSVGIAHVAGNYGFTQENFLVEGAERIQQLGSDSIFIYLNPDFRTVYPDRSVQSWPSSDPGSLAELAGTPPYLNVLGMPFRTIVLTAYSFAVADRVQGISSSPDRLQGEGVLFSNEVLVFPVCGLGKDFYFEGLGE